MVQELRLNKFSEYSRKEVYDFFDPSSPFTTGAGTWGIHGIVKIPNRECDYVFFVTFGQNKLGHTFEEEINEEGILTWQSQPSQKLDNKVIRNLIEHDHTKNVIHLFLRTRKVNPMNKEAEPFTYMGQIAYVTHDIERESPVYFLWQILDWEIPPLSVLEKMNLKLTKKERGKERKTVYNKPSLLRSKQPSRVSNKGLSTEEFMDGKFDFGVITNKNGLLGNQGELLVLEHEKSMLIAGNRSDLVSKIIHTSVVEGDGAGFDILSYTLEGKEKFIVVKTTSGGALTPFFLTSNEVAFSQRNVNSYYLYRLYNYDSLTQSGEYFVLEGDISKLVNLQPTKLKASF